MLHSVKKLVLPTPHHLFPFYNSRTRKASRFLHACLNNNSTKDEIATELSKYRDLFFRSYSVKRNLNKGYVLKKKDLILKKPGTGIGYHQEKRILGRKLKRKLTPNRLIRLSDLE